MTESRIQLELGFALGARVGESIGVKLLSRVRCAAAAPGHPRRRVDIQRRGLEAKLGLICFAAAQAWKVHENRLPRPR